MSHTITVPTAPAGLTAEVNDDRTVDLSWHAVDGADAYEVHELLVDPAHTKKATETGTTSHRGPLKGGAYRYGVKAVNDAGASALSALVDVHVPAPGQGHGHDPLGSGVPTLPDGAPGHALDLSHWYLTLPIARDNDPHKPKDVFQAELRDFRHELFDVRDGAVEYRATVEGVATSSNTESSRCELRETKGGTGGGDDNLAWWDFDSVTHSLTCTLTCDPTGASPRQECIVGQIHAADDKPPIVLSVEMKNQPGVLAAFVRGTTPKRHELPGLTLRPDTVFSYRIAVSGNECHVFVAEGDVTALPDTPTKTFSAHDLGNPGKCYFKAGAYNKSPIEDGSGESVVRQFRLALD